MTVVSWQRCFALAAVASLIVAAGCPSSVPPTSSKGSGSGAEAAVDHLKENAEDVAALKAAKAYLQLDSDGHVVGVELNRTSGNDADLAHVAGLPYVRELGADVRGVTDAGLAKLAGHPNLRAIKLEQSGITDLGIGPLQKLPKLEDLDVRRTGLSAAGYAEIGKIAGLKRLRVVQNAQRFNDDCCLAIKGLKNLELLDMQDCSLPSEKGLITLQGFPKLRNVRLYGPNVSDKVLSYLSGSKELRALSLEQCSSLTAAGFDHIQGLNNLTEIGLFGAVQVNDAAVEKLSGLTKLKKLDLRQTPISSLALSYLKKMKDLQALDLSETAAVGNEGLEHISGLKNLEDLNLWSCQIDDQGLPAIAGLTKLKKLNLDKCNITSDGLKHLAPLVNLEFLHIGSTQVGDEGLEHLAALKKLKHLVVTYLPNVTNSGVEKLKHALPQLDEVEQ